MYAKKGNWSSGFTSGFEIKPLKARIECMVKNFTPILLKS